MLYMFGLRKYPNIKQSNTWADGLEKLSPTILIWIKMNEKIQVMLV